MTAIEAIENIRQIWLRNDPNHDDVSEVVDRELSRPDPSPFLLYREGVWNVDHDVLEEILDVVHAYETHRATFEERLFQNRIDTYIAEGHTLEESVDIAIDHEEARNRRLYS